MAPWDLVEQPIAWLQWANIAESAEAQAQAAASQGARPE